MVNSHTSIMSGKGFTLIELAITLVLVALLLLMAVPFARGWIDNNRQLQIRSLLWEGISQARALALRNPNALPSVDPVSGISKPVVCLLFSNDGQLSVNLSSSPRGSNIASCAPSSVQPVWSVTLPQDVVLKLVDSQRDLTAQTLSSTKSFTCLALNSRAQRLTRLDNCDDSDLTLDRMAIGFHAQDPLYVHLF